MYSILRNRCTKQIYLATEIHNRIVIRTVINRQDLSRRKHPDCTGTPTELAEALGSDLPPNKLTMKLGINAGRLSHEYGIHFEKVRTHAGRQVTNESSNDSGWNAPAVIDLDLFTVYRGGSEDIKKAAYSMSWTLSQETAEWFVKRHELTHPGEQHLYKGTISADRVIAYIGGRDEFEIVQYRGVRNIEEIPLAGLSPEFEAMRNSGSPFDLGDPEKARAYFDRWYGRSH